MNLTSPSSSSTSRKSKSRKTLNCCSLAVSSSVSSLVPPSSDDTPLSLTSIMSKSPHDEKITWREERRLLRQSQKAFKRQMTFRENGNKAILHKITNWRTRENKRWEVSYRWVFGESNFLSTKRQNIHQLLSGSFLNGWKRKQELSVLEEMHKNSTSNKLKRNMGNVKSGSQFVIRYNRGNSDIRTLL